MTTATSPSRQNLASTIGKNTVFGVVAKLAQVGTRFVTVPIVIAHLGLGGYGIWSIIMTTSAYMRFGSVGIKSAFQKYVAEATATNEFEGANQLLSTGCAFMLALSVAGSIPVVMFSKSLAKASGIPPEFLSDAAASFSILAFIMLLSNVGAVYEAIVMGGHRIDLARNFATGFTIAEAVAIVIALHFGCGLRAMASVMAVSELGFVVCCYFASRRILPAVQVRAAFVTRKVARELIRFAGSYQLVNILEVLYASILPLTVLREFGPAASGVYAIVTRLTSAATMLSDSFLLPILSGGAMVFATGSAERMQTLISKSFKVTLGSTLFPLGFLSVFGPSIVFAWTGQADPSFAGALWLVSLATLFGAISLLQLVLYRTSGKAVMDNVRQVLRIATLLCIALFAHRLGFFGILSGLAVSELIGMTFMLFAMVKTFPAFRGASLALDMLKLCVATAGILTLAILASRIPLPALEGRIADLMRLAIGCSACALAAWPALRLTGSLTSAEWGTITGTFAPWRARFAQPLTKDSNGWT
jgi:O-antigen/teichoic acid export membrane protein